MAPADLVHRMRLWLRAVVARPRVERDLEREMRFHLEMEIDAHVRAGMSPDEARRRAMIDFGGVDRHTEAVRDERGTRLLEETAADLRYAWRGLAKRPGFAALAVVTTAIGIGATTVVFSIANQLLLRPVAGVTAPRGLGTVVMQQVDDPRASSDITLRRFAVLNDSSRRWVVLAGSRMLRVQWMERGGLPIRVRADLVAGDYFNVLGVAPQAGRMFIPDAGASPAQPRVVVISDRLWTTRFNRAPDAIGKRVEVNGEQVEIVAVAAPGFRGTTRADTSDLWLPVTLFPVLTHDEETRRPLIDAVSVSQFIARRRADVSWTQAQEGLRHTMRGVNARYPDRHGRAFTPVVSPGIGAAPSDRAAMWTVLRLLFGVVTLVMLIACANTVNLLLVRGVQRRGEVAVRRALGASGGRLVRQSLTEGLMVSLAGGLGGVAIAYALGALVEGQQLVLNRTITGLTIDWRVAAFALVVSVGAGIICGVAPVVWGEQPDLVTNLKHAGRSVSGRSRVRRALTVVQVSASMTLLVGALLLAATLRVLSRVDLGFDETGIVATEVVSPPGYSRERFHQLQIALLKGLADAPVVRAVSATSAAPFIDGTYQVPLRRTDTSRAQPVGVDVAFVSQAYFRTLGVRVQGRPFTEQEIAAPASAGGVVISGMVTWTTHADGSVTKPHGTVILSRTAARELFGDANPIGQLIYDPNLSGGAQYSTVVGVADDARTFDLRHAMQPAAYWPLPVSDEERVTLLVRSALSPRDVHALIQRVLEQVDPTVPVALPEPMSVGVRRAMATELLLGRLVGVLAVLALVLAAVGLYSVIAHSVAERTREMGIRVALGAQPAGVVALVMRQSVVLTLGGVVLGGAGALAAGRTLSRLLFGLTATEPLFYGIGAALLLMMAVLAALGPARAATRVDPVEALRSE